MQQVTVSTSPSVNNRTRLVAEKDQTSMISKDIGTVAPLESLDEVKYVYHPTRR